jgi:hypothetical protein
MKNDLTARNLSGKATRHLLFWLILGGCLPLMGWSQEPAKREPPSGPLFRPAPTYSQWVITFSYPQDRTDGDAKKLPSLPPNFDRKVLTTKTGNIIHEETLSVSGVKFDKWQVAHFFYIKPAGQSFWGECQGPSKDANNTFLMPLPDKGFRDLDWISTETYAGAVMDGGLEYLIFVPENAKTVDISSAAKLQALHTVAYINAETRLPSILKKDDIIRNYKFFPLPQQMQALPDDLAKQIKAVSEKRAKLFAPPTKEY